MITGNGKPKCLQRGLPQHHVVHNIIQMKEENLINTKLLLLLLVGMMMISRYSHKWD
jgi:hypothetical protein